MRYKKTIICLGIAAILWPQTAYSQISHIQVECGGNAGTATLVNDVIITNAHVVTGCDPTIEGKPVIVTDIDIASDLVLLGDGRDFTGLVCARLIGRGEAAGFAAGGNYPIKSEVHSIEGFGPLAEKRLEGFAYPGMSGGPVTQGGLLYGIVKGTNEAYTLIAYIPGDQVCKAFK